ncbi:MAG: hypothetical protein HQK87_03170 [Nitrospinae bacterium]|nr:hypothetical protein [Nitrospinota bacterium]
MAPLAYWAARFVAEGFREPTLDPDRSAAIAVALTGEMDRMASDGVEGARLLLGTARRIVTLSWSSTVLSLLAGGLPRSTPVLVGESRPLNEGRMTAERLASAMFRVTVVTDAALSGSLADGDILLIGADTILPDGGVVNKSGSYPAALAAREAGVPLWVAADTAKIAPVGSHPRHEEGNPSHVWLDHPGLCRNPVFETVPARLVTGYLTERGAVGRAEIEREADRTARLLRLLEA